MQTGAYGSADEHMQSSSFGSCWSMLLIALVMPAVFAPSVGLLMFILGMFDGMWYAARNRRQKDYGNYM